MALTIVCVSLFISFFASLLSFSASLKLQQERDFKLVSQLAKTVEQTASIAAYLNDVELANEIINGLVINDLVHSASMVLSDQSVHQSSSFSVNENQLVLALPHPFSQDEWVGEININPDLDFMNLRANQEATREAKILIVISLVTFLVTLLLVHKLLTQPLKNLVNSFSLVDPSKPDTMKMLSYRRKDEIGLLVGGINELMKRLHIALNKEVVLRKKTQALEAKFRLIFEQASAGICLFNKNNLITVFNPSFKKLFNFEDGKEINFSRFFPDRAEVEEQLSLFRQESTTRQFSMDLKYINQFHQEVWLHCIFAKINDQRNVVREDDGQIIEAIMYDITERVERELKTKEAAEVDLITSLNTRAAGEQLLEDMLQNTIENDLNMVLMMVDLDKFKPVNDSFGHDAGDQVLAECGSRIRNLFKQDAICIRWGGDEFVIAFQTENLITDKIKLQGKELVLSLSMPFDLTEHDRCLIGASVGIVCAPRDAKSTEALLTLADQTMYQVKESGRGDCYMYSEFKVKKQSQPH